LPPEGGIEENNPVTKLMVDWKGFDQPEVLGEKVLSAIVEFMTRRRASSNSGVLDRYPEIDTVFRGHHYQVAPMPVPSVRACRR
jgi:hypothetical protein